MLNKKYVYDEGPPTRIGKITFGVFDPLEMTKLSHLQVAHYELYKNGFQPYPHGVLDKRLGISSKTDKCDTCGENTSVCSGHFGYIKLELPVFHIGYFKTVLFILQVICKTCSRILLAENERIYFLREAKKTMDTEERTFLIKDTIAKKCKRCTVCPHCGATNGTVKKVGCLKLIHEKYKKPDERDKFKKKFEFAITSNNEIAPHISKAHEDLNPIRVKEIFQAMVEEDCEILNIVKPERFILTNFLVPPVCIRPSVVMGGASGSNEDDLTVKLREILLGNHFIREGIDQDKKTINQLMEDWLFLQQNCAMYINSEAPGIVPGNGPAPKPIRALTQRLKGKHGRFRGNLSGKRADFTSRTVISPDPNLRIDQVAVPIYVARILTYPERVYKNNIKKLRQCIINGEDKHPGANYVEVAELGVKKKLKSLSLEVRKEIAQKLKYGDIVERHLEDGDIVLFNRQPSLHKLSIMCHRAKVMPWRTFRFNECVCTPYNADFDGDEMNLHLPQTEEARAEAKTLMIVTRNLITPRSGEPLIGAIQDFITASYLLTRKDAFYTKYEITQFCGFIYDAGETILDIPPPCILKPVELWSGKQVFGLLLRPNKDSTVVVNMSAKGRSYSKEGEAMCPQDGFILIRNSELLSGILDKSVLGSGSKNSIFHYLLRDFGPEVAADRMTRIGKVCSRWLMNRGFSIGVSDVQPSKILSTKKEELIAEGYKKCDYYLTKYKNGTLKTKPGLSAEQTLESKMNQKLSQIRDNSGKLCIELLHHSNSPLIMAISGSKGSNINISQMVVCVGQQTVGGSRVPNGFLNRTLPHFEYHSKTPAAKGFVRNSFYSGLTPTEFFFHTMGGREGLVDTAVKTAETGYMARKLMKALEDLSIQYDGTVRNSIGSIVQFVYGGDRLDPANMEADGTPMDFERVLIQSQAFVIRNNDPPLSIQQLKKRVIRNLKSSDSLSHLSTNFKRSIWEFFSGENGIFKKMQNIRDQTSVWKEDGDAHHSSNDIICLNDNDGDMKMEDIDNGESKKVRNRKLTESEYEKVISNIFSITERQLEKFFELCAWKFHKATTEPATAVGALAAQSISEPSTQMTLKTFHFAGVASMNITQGVPRIKEIISASKNISTPIITASLQNKYDINHAYLVKARVERSTLSNISKYIKVVMERKLVYIKVKLDVGRIKELYLYDLNMNTIRNAIIASKVIKSKDYIEIKNETTFFVFSDQVNKEKLLYSIQKIKEELPKIIIFGIPTAQRAVISIVDKTKPPKYELLVEGTDLLPVMNVTGVDGTHTFSNDIMQTEIVLGIEAARSTIMKEIITTMKSHGIAVDFRHITLLADTMTYKGKVLGIQRHGVQKMKDSTLMLASFEKTVDHLFEAAEHNRSDDIMGVSECIIVGATVPLGTGAVKLIRKNRGSLPYKYGPLLLDSNASFSLNL